MREESSGRESISFVSDNPVLKTRWFLTGYTPEDAKKPPSMGITVPVTKPAASSLMSQFMQPINSVASPKRRMGVC